MGQFLFLEKKYTSMAKTRKSYDQTWHQCIKYFFTSAIYPIYAAILQACPSPWAPALPHAHCSGVVLSGIRGSLEECMTGGGSDVFLWVENLHARDHSRICLGLKRIREFFSVFGSYLRANFSFRVFVAISGSEKY